MDLKDGTERTIRGRGRVASVALVGAGVIAGGTFATLGVASAGIPNKTAAPTPTTSVNAPGPERGPGMGPGMSPGMGPGIGIRGRGIHGTEIVQTGTNKYVTIDSQVGTVLANDGTTLAVKSVDGFTADYAFASASIIIKAGAKVAIADIKVGDQVHIRAMAQSRGNPVVRLVLDGFPPFGEPRAGDHDFGNAGPGNAPGPI